MPRLPILPLIPLFAALALPLALSGADAGQTISDFESGVPWKFIGGEEFPGAKGSTQFDSKVVHGGKQSLRLDIDFSGGGNYVGTWLDTSLIDADKEVHLWIKSKNVGGLMIRFIDSGGQCHQTKGVPVAANKDWQEVVLVVSKLVGGEHWSGANDGVFHGPSAGFGINVESTAVTAVGPAALWFDDVTVRPVKK